VDTLGSLALVTVELRAGVSLLLQTHYLAPLPLGASVTADCRLLKAGRNYGVVQVDLRLQPRRSDASPAAPQGEQRLAWLLSGRLAATGTHVKALTPATSMAAVLELAPGDALQAARGRHAQLQQQFRELQQAAAAGEAAVADPEALGGSDDWRLSCSAQELRARLRARPQRQLRLPDSGGSAAAAAAARRAALFLHAVVDCTDGYDSLLAGGWGRGAIPRAPPAPPLPLPARCLPPPPKDLASDVIAHPAGAPQASTSLQPARAAAPPACPWPPPCSIAMAPCTVDA
jgi:hypothetical protein